MDSFKDKVRFFDRETEGSVTCIYGESGSGKSYKANQLRKEHTVVLDGDGVRHWVNKGLGYSYEDRKTNNIRIAGMAILLAKQGFDVIVATVRADIAYEEIRKHIKKTELIKL